MRYCENTVHGLSHGVDVLITTQQTHTEGCCRSEAELCAVWGGVRGPKEDCLSQLHTDSLPSKAAGCDRWLLQKEPWGGWSAS